MNSKLGSENKFQKCRYIFGWGATCLILYFEKKKKKIRSSIVQACPQDINNGLSRRNVIFCSKIRKKFVSGILKIKYQIMG